MSETTSIATIIVDSHMGPGGRVFDAGSEHENLREAAAELTQRRDAVAEEQPGFEEHAFRKFAGQVVGDYDADRLFGLAKHVREQEEEDSRRNVAHVLPGGVLDKSEFSRGELREVAREIGDYRARDNFQKLAAALRERALTNQQSVSEILGGEQPAAEARQQEPEAADGSVEEAGASPQSAQNPQGSADPVLEQERVRLAAAREQYETAVPQVAAIAWQDLVHEAAQLRGRGIHSVEELAKADPGAYAQYTAKVQRLGRIAQEVGVIQQRAAQQQAQQWADFATHQDRAFLQQNPEFADPSRFAAAKSDLLATFREMGIGEQELAAAYHSNAALRDARVQTMLFKLAQAHMAQKRAAQALRGRRANPVPTVQRPGVAGPRPDYNQQRRARLSNQLDQATGQKALKIAAEMRALSRGVGRRGGSPFV